MVRHIHFRSFTVFQDFQLTFTPGLQVITGANATGKTHLLKLLYVFLKQHRRRSEWQDISTISEMFQVPEQNFHLLFRHQREGFDLQLTDDAGFTVGVALQEDLHGRGKYHHHDFEGSTRCVLLSDTLLSSKMEHLDPVSKDLLDVLSAGTGNPVFEPLCQPLITLLDGHLPVLKAKGLFFEKAGRQLPAVLFSAGWQKLAFLVLTLQHAHLKEGDVLLWDDVDTHLDDGLLANVLDVLTGLASLGLQVIMTVHNQGRWEERCLHSAANMVTLLHSPMGVIAQQKV